MTKIRHPGEGAATIGRFVTSLVGGPPRADGYCSQSPLRGEGAAPTVGISYSVLDTRYCLTARTRLTLEPP